MIPVLYDKTGAVKNGDLTDTIECLVEEERNGIFELTMIYPANDSLIDSLQKEAIVVADANDYLKNQKFRIYNTRKLMANRIEICARHISFDLAHDWVDSISIENQSCEYALNTIFRNSQFSSRFRGHSDIINAQNFKVNKVTCLEAIGGTSGSIIDTYGTGAEILRDNTDIHVLNRRGRDNDVTIEYRKNLTGLEVEEDTTDLVTRIMPYAIYNDEDNQEVEVRGDFIDSPLINNYAHPYVKYIDYSEKFEDDEVPTATKLNNLATKEYTNNKVDIPKCNYKIEFVPLSKCAGYEGLEDRINLCDVVTVKDSRYSIDTQAKVIKVVFDVLRGRYDSMELGEPRTTLGDIIGGTGDGPTQGPPGPPGPPGEPGEDGSIGDFPETLPEVPNITAKVYGFANIEISWTFENKVYYSYELYGSKTKGFVPNTFNLIFSGQASTYLYQAEPNETWYFRACAINTHGQRTEFSAEVEVNTVKISDLSNYVESAAIGDALIGELRLDRGWVGQLRGNWIDAKQLSVTDGNGKRTLDIDSFGNVNLDVASLKIKSSNVATKTEVSDAKHEAINNANSALNSAIANYYTKAQTDSAIKVAKESIELGISSTYETKSNVSSQMSSALSSAKSYADTKKTEAINSANSTLTMTIANYYTKSQTDSAIKVAKDSINLNVSSLEEKVDNIETNVVNTQIGGTNLFLETDYDNTTIERFKEKWYHSKTAHTVMFSAYTGGNAHRSDNLQFVGKNVLTSRINIATAISDGITQTSINPYGENGEEYIKLEPNTNYTLSFYAYVGGNAKSFNWTIWQYDDDGSNRVRLTNNGKNVTYTCDTYTGALEYHEFHFTTSDKVNYQTRMYNNFKTSLTTGNSDVYLYHLKLEKGNKATDWTPSPQDISSNIATAKTEAINSANSTLTSTIANYYTKSQTDSQIKVAKDSITQSVSSTYATKTDVTSSINGVNSSISSLQTRMNTAEQKITDNAIVSTVTSSSTYKNNLSGKVDSNKIVSTINQTAEAVKINASKIQLEGAVTAGESNRYVKIENANYSVFNGNNVCVRLGYKNWNGWDGVPEFLMGYKGFRYSESTNTGEDASYFGMQTWGRNVKGNQYAFHDIYYRSDKYGKQHHLRFTEDGLMQLNSLKRVELQANSNSYIVVDTSGGLTFPQGVKTFGVSDTIWLHGSNFGLVWGKYSGKEEYNLRPTNTNLTDLGHSSYRWRTIYATNGTVNTSDINLKENIVPIVSEVDEVARVANTDLTSEDFYQFVKELPLYSYDYKSETPDRSLHNIGFIAQDIANTPVGDEFVFEGEDGIYQYNMQGYVGVLAVALQNALKKIDVLEEKVSQLESRF